MSWTAIQGLTGSATSAPPSASRSPRDVAQNIRMVELAPEEARPILRAFPAAVPAGVGFMKRSGVVSDGTPDEVEGLAGRLPVFRIDPIT